MQTPIHIHYNNINNKYISFLINIYISIQFAYNFSTIYSNKLVFDSFKRYDSVLSFYAKFIKFGWIWMKLHSILFIYIKNLFKFFFNIIFDLNIYISIQFAYNFPTIYSNKLVFDLFKRYDSGLSFYAKIIKFGWILMKLCWILFVYIKNLLKFFFNIIFDNNYNLQINNNIMI